MPDPRERLVQIVKELALRHSDKLDALKVEASGLEREDFVWHYMLQSFSTWGSSRGWAGLINTSENYQRVTYDALLPLTRDKRIEQVDEAFRAAQVRYPRRKAEYVADNLELVESLGGLAEVRRALLAAPGPEAKIEYLSQFKGVSEKYSRNILMDVYHPEFHESIAIDQRIQRVTEAIGVEFDNYDDHESYLLDVAHEAGLSGWELDRLLYHFHDEVMVDLKNESRSPRVVSLARIRERFEIAVENFGRSCIDLQSNEKAFQAWYAASVIHEFGMARVYREIHLLKPADQNGILKYVGPRYEGLPNALVSGNELIPDLCVSWEPNIDTRHSAVRSPEGLRGARGMLRQLAIVSEFKATGSTKTPTPRVAVRTHGEAAKLGTYMVILDNAHSGDDGDFIDNYTAECVEGLMKEIAKKWPGLTLPTVLIAGQGRFDVVKPEDK
jgi:hypothetical protein